MGLSTTRGIFIELFLVNDVRSLLDLPLFHINIEILLQINFNDMLPHTYLLQLFYLEHDFLSELRI